MRDRILLLLVEAVMEGFDALVSNQYWMMRGEGPAHEQLDRRLWGKLGVLQDEAQGQP